MVDETVAMLEATYGPPEPAIRPVRLTDAQPLQTFYNALSADARRRFRPRGWTAALDDCTRVVEQAEQGSRYDLVLESASQLVGWAFLQRMDAPKAHLGIGIADSFTGRGYGKQLMQGLVDEARRRGKEGIGLILVQTNERALRLYRGFGFEIIGEQTGSDGQSYYQMELDLRG